MSTPRFTTSSPSATQAVGRSLAPLLAADDLVLLAGDLGAGKTALVKGVAEGLGVAEPVTSPTFNILLVHHGRLDLYHVDLYRLEDSSQLEDIDYFETIEAGGVTLVEWGDRFPEAAVGDHVKLRITITGDESREFSIAGVGDRGMQLAASWADACVGLPGVVFL